MFAAWVLAAELFHFHLEMLFLGWIAQIGDIFSFVPDLQECRGPATFRACRYM